MELQTHLLVCEERLRQCKVNGCHFAGNFKEMEQHNKEQAEKHVSLLTERSEKLLDVLLRKVRPMGPTRPMLLNVFPFRSLIVT